MFTGPEIQNKVVDRPVKNLRVKIKEDNQGDIMVGIQYKGEFT